MLHNVIKIDDHKLINANKLLFLTLYKKKFCFSQNIQMTSYLILKPFFKVQLKLLINCKEKLLKIVLLNI